MTYVFFLAVGEIKDIFNAVFLGKFIGIRGALVQIVARRSRAVERRLFNISALNLAEIREDYIGVKIVSVVGIAQRIELLNILVFARLVKRNRDL